MPDAIYTDARLADVYDVLNPPTEDTVFYLALAAREQVVHTLRLTREEGAFYKSGFAVLYEGAMANWLLFQWWTHNDGRCQLLSYSKSDDPLAFTQSTRPVRACVYETAIIWYEKNHGSDTS